MIYYELEKSPYTYLFNNITFYFSSELYLKKFINSTSKMALGIFFIHVLIIKIFINYFNFIIINKPISVIILCIVTFILSYLIIIVLSKVLFIKKYILMIKE